MSTPREHHNEFSFVLSSNADNGATNITHNGSSFEILLTEPINIPREAYNLQLSAPVSTMWWNIPNINTGTNDLLNIKGYDNADVIKDFNIQIPQGLYKQTDLNQYIKNILIRQGAKTDGKDTLIDFTPDQNNQRIVMTFKYPNTTVDFTSRQSIASMLGFENTVYTSATSTQFIAPLKGEFNSSEYYLLHCDLVNKGLVINGKYDNTIAQIYIDVPVGYQNISRPFNPPVIDCSNLKGTTRSKIKLWITDDKNQPINTNGEYFTARLVLSYNV